MSLLNSLIKRRLSMESVVDDSKIGGGPETTDAQPNPEIASGFEEEAHGSKHDTPGTTEPSSPDTANTEVAQTDSPAAADSGEVNQEPTEVAGDDNSVVDPVEPAASEPAGDAGVPSEDTPAADQTSDSDATQAVTDTKDTTDEQTTTDAGAENDGSGANAGDTSSTETDPEVGAGTEPTADTGAEGDTAAAEETSGDPKPDTENPDNLDPIKDLPDETAESDLKPEVQEAEKEGDEVEIDSDTDTDAELEEKADLVAGYSEAKQTLEEIAEEISESLMDGGLSDVSMVVAQDSVNDVLEEVGMEPLGFPSTESLKTLAGRRENTQLVMESIVDRAKELGRKIWQTIVELIERFLGLKFNGKVLLDDFKKIEDKLDKLINERKLSYSLGAKINITGEYCRSLGIREGISEVKPGEVIKVGHWLPKMVASVEKQLQKVSDRLEDTNADVPETVDLGSGELPGLVTVGTNVSDQATLNVRPTEMLNIVRAYAEAVNRVMPALSKTASIDKIQKFAEQQLVRRDLPSEEEKAKAKALISYLPQALRVQRFVRNNIACMRLVANHYCSVASV